MQIMHKYKPAILGNLKNSRFLGSAELFLYFLTDK